MKHSTILTSIAMSAFLAAAACGGADAAPSTADRAAAAPASVAATGTIKEVKMISGSGELFEPAQLTAKRGDVLRFALGAGVHNVSFPAAKNPAGVALPDPSPYLQIPGQTHDLLVELPPGEYYFHCDPHAALGMVGTLTVTD